MRKVSACWRSIRVRATKPFSRSIRCAMPLLTRKPSARQATDGCDPAFSWEAVENLVSPRGLVHAQQDFEHAATHFGELQLVLGAMPRHRGNGNGNGNGIGDATAMIMRLESGTRHGDLDQWDCDATRIAGKTLPLCYILLVPEHVPRPATFLQPRRASRVTPGAG